MSDRNNQRRKITKADFVEMRHLFMLIGSPIVYIMVTLGIVVLLLQVEHMAFRRYPIEEVGYAYSVLKPTLLANSIVFYGVSIICTVNIAALVGWVWYIYKNLGIEVIIRLIVFIVTIIFLTMLPALMLTDTDLGGELRYYQKEILLYEQGQVHTYYGPLELGDISYLGLGGSDESDHPTMQWFKAPIKYYTSGGADYMYLKTRIEVVEDLMPLENQMYKVTYLEESGIITDIEVSNKEELTTSTDQGEHIAYKDIISSKINITENATFKEWIDDKKLIETNKPLWRLINSENKGQIYYIEAHLNTDKEIDYMMMLVQDDVAIMSLALVTEEEQVKTIRIPYDLMASDIEVDILNTSTVGVNDLLITSPYSETLRLLTYDGVDTYTIQGKK